MTNNKFGGKDLAGVLGAMALGAYLGTHLRFRNRWVGWSALAAIPLGWWLAWYNSDRTLGFCQPPPPGAAGWWPARHSALSCDIGHVGIGIGTVLVIAGFITWLCMLKWVGGYGWHADRTIPYLLRKQVELRDYGLCRACDLPATADDPLQIDHYIPVALGGPTVLDNLRLLHASANKAKGAHWPWVDNPGYCLAWRMQNVIGYP